MENQKTKKEVNRDRKYPRISRVLPVRREMIHPKKGISTKENLFFQRNPDFLSESRPSS